jgi:hypothetical protein
MVEIANNSVAELMTCAHGVGARNEFANNSVAELMTCAQGVRWFEYTGASDTTPPTVTVVSPAVGTTISPTDALVIDVEDETSLQTSILMAKYLSAILPSPSEVIWDGSSFLYPFTGSTRSSISGGWRYSITRTNGWSSSPTIKIYAVDSEGNEA